MGPKALIGKAKSLPLGKKVALGVALAALLSVAVVSILWVKSPEYRLLYGGLSPSDASSVITALKEMHVPYKLENGGRDVYVPSSRLYEVRIELAGKGIPKGGQPGFEIFDKTSLGVTDFVQKLNYQRALQGELARTISSMDEVKWARVHIAMPKESLFVEKTKRPKASVLVQLVPGKSLGYSQVKAITYLVASSVPGMRPDDVVVVDTEGHMVSGTGEESPAGWAGEAMRIKHELEAQYEEKVRDILSGIVGPGKAVVRVSLDMDFSKSEVTQELYDPDNSVVVSEQETQEFHSGTGAVPMGVPGVLSNVAQGKAAGSQSMTSSDRKVSKVTNYEISKTIKHIKDPEGKIKRISVAVVVDGTYKKVKGKEEYVPRSDEEMEKITGLVKKAIGFDKERGDQVEVVNMPLKGMEAERAEASAFGDMEALQKKEWIYRLIVSAMKGMVLVFLVFVFYRLVSRVSSEIKTTPSESLQIPAKVGEVEEKLKEGERGQMYSAGIDSLREELSNIAKKEPERIARVIQSWIREGGEGGEQ